MNPIDLHVHSRFSDDGELPPEVILDRGRRLGLGCLAITDHNSVKGVPGAMARGAQLGIEVIPAIEIDCAYAGVNLHLLGYFIDASRGEYLELEEDITAQEAAAFDHKAENLALLGLPVDKQAVKASAQGGIVGAERFAEHLLDREDCADHPLLIPYRPGGGRADMPLVNFYWDFFAQGKPAHVPMNFMALEEAVDLVVSSGGVPVLAHPGVNLKARMDLLDPILATGVKGLEVFSTYHDADQRAHFLETARGRGMFVTCGSDFHGKNKPGIELGGHGCDLDPGAILTALKRAAGRA